MKKQKLNSLIYVNFSGESKRPANHTVEGMASGSGSASGSVGMGRSSGGAFGGGGGGVKGGSAGSKPKPSTPSSGQSGQGVVTTANNFKWGNPKSTLTYGHTFSQHGAKLKPNQLMDRAKAKGHQIGQWLDEKSAADFLTDIAKKGARSV